MCSSAAFAGGPGSSPGRTSRRMPIRSAGESFAFPTRPGPAPRSAHRPSGSAAAGVSHRRSPMDDQRLGALLRPQGGRRGPGGAAPHRERRRARIGPPPPVAGSIALSAPRRRRGLRRTGRGSCPESAPQGSGPDERTRGRERSQVVAGWRAPAHETAFAADEPLIVRERGTGCALVEGGERLWWGNSLTGDSARQGGPYVQATSRERAIRTPDEASTPRPRHARRARARASLRP